MGGFFIAIFSGVALPKDNGQWGNIDPETKAWFESLKDKNGIGCCDTSDGTRVEDPDWRVTDTGRYEIKIGDRWFLIPPEAVLDGNNRVGFAIVWIAGGKIRCFLPGSGT